MSDAAIRATFTTFEESTREEWAEIVRQLPTTQAMAAHNAVEQLRMLGRDHGGFPVSRLEHSLQTATRAEEDGRDEEYVLCALLHDIGDTLAPFNHPVIAAGLLHGFVSEAHHWMVEHHGIFQGYYFWHHIGLDRDTRDQFRDSPYYELTEEFCAKYDQTAFDPDYVERAARALRAARQEVPRAGRARGVVPRLRALTMTMPRPSRPATAPITAGRARGLVALGALVLVGLGVGVGRYAAHRSLFGFDGAAWSTQAVVVRVSDGSDATAALAVAFALALSGLAAWGLWRLVRSHLDPQPTQRRNWIRAIGAMWVAGAVATVGGFLVTGRDDGVGGGWVAGNLLDAGDDVTAELTSGYVERPQPGGAGVSRSIRLPAVIAYEVKGEGCTVVIDDQVEVVDDTITLIPRCSPLGG